PIAGPAPAIRQEGPCGQLRVGVALREHRPPHLEVAVDTRGDRLGVLVDDPYLAAVHRSAVALRQLLVGVAFGPQGDHRALGHAEAMTDLGAELALDLPVHLGRLRRTAPSHHAEARYQWLARPSALLLQQA